MTTIKRVTLFAGLEIYALACAFYQFSLGVRTDEAKYLLDIPYPHPPLARFILSLLNGWAYEEIFWRIVFATLLVQAAWLILDSLKQCKPIVQTAGVAAWLLSASVLIQAGSVMMVVLTALQALLLVRLSLRDRPVQPYLLGLFWLGSLFTAYQAILFFPLVFGLLQRSRCGIRRMFFILAVPVGLLALYTLTNPLALASFANQAGQDASETLLQHLTGTIRLWAIGGSIVLSTAGTFGLLLRPKAGLIFSFLLVIAFVFLARYDYYAVLFTPLFIGGLILLLRHLPSASVSLMTLMPVGLVLSLMVATYNTVSIVPRITHVIDASSGTGDTLIVGGFGHDWQFYSSRPIHPFSTSLLPEAHAVVCLAVCEEMQHQTGWRRLADEPVEVWVR